MRLLPVPALLLLLLLLLLLGGASADHHGDISYACPENSWCVQRVYCDTGHIAHDQLIFEDVDFKCGLMPYTPTFVCCDTQELLPNEFQPSFRHWHHGPILAGDSSPDHLVVPWKGHPLEEKARKRLEHHRQKPQPVKDDVTVEVEDDDPLLVIPNILPARTRPAQGYVTEDSRPFLEVPAVRNVCPARSICLPWTLCDKGDVVYENTGTDDYLCGITADTDGYLCCGRPLRVSEFGRAVEEPADKPEPVSEHPNPRIVPLFTPPPPETPPPAMKDDQEGHYLEKLFHDRQRREVAEGASFGRVIFPSEIAKSRLEGVQRQDAAGPDGETIGARLKDLRATGKAGRVKLGSLSPPPSGDSRQPPQVAREPSSPAPHPLPTASHQEPPTLPPVPLHQAAPLPASQQRPTTADREPPAPPHERQKQSAGQALNPRTVENEVDIKPLPADVWTGAKPNSRTSDSEAGLLGKILNGISDGFGSRHHQGQFLGPSPPQRPPFLPQQPPFHDPFFNQPPDHLRPPPHQDFFDPSQQGHDHFFRPSHQGHDQFFDPSQQNHAFVPPSQQQQQEHHFPPTYSPEQQIPPHQPVDPTYEQEQVYVPPLPHQPSQPGSTCGRGSQLGLHARITSQRGEDGVTSYGEYPWHVAVLAADLTYLCAGVLVAPRLALTVAHCLGQLAQHEPLLVRVGDWDLASDGELYPAYDVNVIRRIVHPEYYAGNLQNDLALLVLDPPVEGLPHVRPACLPPAGADFVHQHCWVTGWGQARHVAGDRHDPGSYSWLLKEAPLAVQAPHACQTHLRATHLGPFYLLPAQGALCAVGRGGNDACFGDGGGALVCPLLADGPDGPFYVAGLVSWGLGCGQDIPAVYTKVSDYYHWITAHLHELERSPPLQYARTDQTS